MKQQSVADSYTSDVTDAEKKKNSSSSSSNKMMMMIQGNVKYSCYKVAFNEYYFSCSVFTFSKCMLLPSYNFVSIDMLKCIVFTILTVYTSTIPSTLLKSPVMY